MPNDLGNILSEGVSADRVLGEQSTILAQKWEKTGLLEGMSSDYDKKSMAILLENQARQLIKEASSTGTTAGQEEWSGVALPLVRRVFSEITAKDFVSVQPMNLPSGLVFYLEFKYASAQPGFNNTVLGRTNAANGVEGGDQTSTIHGVTNQAGTPTEGLYGAGRFGYSINDRSASAGAGTIASSGSVLFKDINFDADLSASLAAGQLYHLYITASDLTNYDTEGVRAFIVSNSVANVGSQFQSLTSIATTAIAEGAAAAGAKTTGTYVRFTISGSIDSPLTDYQVSYHVQPTDITRGDFEEGGSVQAPGSPIDIPELNIELRSEPIVAKTRKLKAKWTPEFAQDLNAYHSIDAEAELTSMLSEYISMEIDLEILDMLLQNAITTEYWSTKVGFEYDPDTTLFNQNNATAQAYNQQTWFRTLGTKIEKVSNLIHQKTMRGGANFLVTSPNVATILRSIPGYTTDTSGDGETFGMGAEKVGMMNERWNVYKIPYWTENVILMGYRGNQFLETGAVYAPYIPLIMTPLVYDPETFTPRKGVMTRYAKKMVRPEFYGKIYIDSLDQL